MSSVITTPTLQLRASNIFNIDGTTPIYSAGAWAFKNSSGTVTFSVSDAGTGTITSAGNARLSFSSPNGNNSVIQTLNDQGLIFWNGAQTNVGSYTYAGAWTLGPSSNTTNVQRFTGYGFRHDVEMTQSSGTSNNVVVWTSPFPLGTVGSFIVRAANGSNNGVGRIDFSFQNSPYTSGVVFTNIVNISGTTVSIANSNGFAQLTFTFGGIGTTSTQASISAVVLGKAS